MSRQPTSSSRTGVPQRIGDFEVIRTLGSGSFGKVKRQLASPVPKLFNAYLLCAYVVAKHILTGHRVAMKFISKKKISTTEWVVLGQIPVKECRLRAALQDVR